MFIPLHNSPSLKASQIFTKSYLCAVKPLENFRHNLRMIFSDLLVKYYVVLLISSKIITSTVLESYYYYVSGLRLLKMILICSCLSHFVIRCPCLQKHSSSMDSSPPYTHTHTHTHTQTQLW